MNVTRWLRAAFRDAAAINRAALPWQRMLRTGGTLALAFVPPVAAGRVEDAVIATLFANITISVDQAGPLKERLLVMACCGVACAVAGTFGAALTGFPILIVAATLGLAIGAGCVHSWVPGVEMIPRNALICLIACAYLPLVSLSTAPAAAYGAACALFGALIDGVLRKTLDSPRFVDARQSARFPGFRFGSIYGAAVPIGLVIGNVAGFAKSYWVAITVLVVLQRDRRASLLRVAQRLLGTIAGVVLAYAIVRLLSRESRAGLIAFLVVLPFAWPYGLVRNYGFGIMLLSVWVLLLLDLGLPPGDDVAEILMARLSDTVAGCGVAVVATILGSTRQTRSTA